MNERSAVTRRPMATCRTSRRCGLRSRRGDAGERVLDMCSAPGGKATAIAGSGARRHRCRPSGRTGCATRENVIELDLELPVVTADGTRRHSGPASFDAVLLDAPCSGLGALRRRADARWRIEPNDVRNWPASGAACSLRRARWSPGGRLVYSVCTLLTPRSVDHPRPRVRSRSTRPPRRAVAAHRQGGGCCRRMPTRTEWCMIRYRRAP